MFFDKTEIVYSPKIGLDVVTADSEGRGLLKKKLLLPLLLLLKLKMKAILPIFVGLIGIKAFKALILSKLAIAIVLGFVIYQLVTKAGSDSQNLAYSAYYPGAAGSTTARP
ncbi:hypothetical protein ILUMI_12176 [Ignelater luminosus]|uniref:Uncharacterized protein n=1 Tax=Ignelater luminosus TaxID=2038154 RepID=A0A8K0GD77_IGNLU|nr:hypothetical protein ILUMI_12176 [Ignelater luminosus]